MSVFAKYKRQLRRLLGRREVIRPICDNIIYDNLSTSYSGGSLSHTRMLWVINDSKYMHSIETANKEEDIWSSSTIEYDKDGFSVDKILEIEKSNIGPFEHIINVIYLEKSSAATYLIFNLLQQEEIYTRKQIGVSSISSIIYFADDMEVESEILQKFILGIARNVMLQNKVVCNAVFAAASIPIQDAIHAAMFMNSKYAYGLSGEILKLGQ